MHEDRIVVANRGSGDLSIIDPAREKVVATLAVGGAPNDLALAPDGRRLFVTLGDEDAVALVDPLDARCVGRAGVGRSPAHIYARPRSDEIWVANDGSGDVSVLDTEGNARARIATGAGHHTIAFNTSGARAYVTNIAAATVSIVDASAHRVLEQVAVGRAPHGSALSGDDRRLIVCNAGADSVSVIDTESARVVAEIRVPPGPNQAARVPATGRILIVHTSAAVSLVDTDALACVATAGLGQVPERIVFARDGGRAFINDSQSATIALIDARTLETEACVAVGRGGWHQGLVLDRSGHRLYAVNHGDGTVSAIDVDGQRVCAIIAVGEAPSGIIAANKVAVAEGSRT